LISQRWLAITVELLSRRRSRGGDAPRLAAEPRLDELTEKYGFPVLEEMTPTELIRAAKELEHTESSG